MKTLDEYFRLQKEVHDYFGYEEDWVAIPLDDKRDYFWHLEGESHGDSVLFWESLEEVKEGTWYSYEIYTQRFLPKWVYRGEEYTMVCSNPGVDGNKFLSIFSNSKEHKELPKELAERIIKLNKQYPILDSQGKFEDLK